MLGRSGTGTITARSRRVCLIDGGATVAWALVFQGVFSQV